MTTIKLSDAQLRQLAVMVRDMLKDDLANAVKESLEEKPLLSTEQKAAQLGIKPDTLRRWVREGKIDAVKSGTARQSTLKFR